MKFSLVFIFFISCMFSLNAQIILDPPQRHEYMGKIKKIVSQSCMVKNEDVDGALNREFDYSIYPYSIRVFNEKGEMTERLIVNNERDTVREVYVYEDGIVREQINYDENGQAIARAYFSFKPLRNLLIRKNAYDNTYAKYKFDKKRENIIKIKQKLYQNAKLDKSVELLKYRKGNLVSRKTRKFGQKSNIVNDYNRNGQLIQQVRNGKITKFNYRQNAYSMKTYSKSNTELIRTIEYSYVLDSMKNKVKLLANHNGTQTSELIINTIEYY